MLRRLELSPPITVPLLARCRDRGIRFMSTAFDAESLAFLATLDMPAIKIPSGDITCGPLLLQAARLRQPLIVSTGMSTLADIEAGARRDRVRPDAATANPPAAPTSTRAYASAEGRAALRGT